MYLSLDPSKAPSLGISSSFSWAHNSINSCSSLQASQWAHHGHESSISMPPKAAAESAGAKSIVNDHGSHVHAIPAGNRGGTSVMVCNIALCLQILILTLQWSQLTSFLSVEHHSWSAWNVPCHVIPWQCNSAQWCITSISFSLTTTSYGWALFFLLSMPVI